MTLKIIFRVKFYSCYSKEKFVIRSHKFGKLSHRGDLYDISNHIL